ncbi:hypothetical protein ACFQ1Q_10895 [Winogradskyella litorisediminis]|uniref:Uncharacterized protein n=1 Tax=Winogradskyella litorisediminis TaxID=1156618 RepID=A0ABW3N7V0_9FLAO
MKYLVFVLSVWFSFLAFGQKKKPIYYWDVDNSIMTKRNFLKKKTDGIKNGTYYLSLAFENDTCYIRKLESRKNYGKLNKDELIVLNKYLNELEFKPSARLSIIQFHPGKDRCNSGRLYFKGQNSSYGNSYLKNLKNKISLNNYRIYKKDSTLDYSGFNRFKWNFDEKRLIENMFFKYHYPCGSFVVIDNLTHKYISIYGEYGSSSVTKIVEEIAGKN